MRTLPAVLPLVALPLVALPLAILLVTIVGLSQGFAADASPAAQELHGVFEGQRFWARLKAPDAQFGGNRMLELVYTPPPAEQLAGAHLSDTPFLLVDDRLRIVAWNGRDTGSAVTPNAPTGYRIARDIEKGDGVDRHVENARRTIAGERGWDLRLAPVLLALAWKTDSTDDLRVVDLFGPRHAEALTIRWAAATVTIAGQSWTIVPGADGKVQEVKGADGKAILTVMGRL